MMTGTELAVQTAASALVPDISNHVQPLPWMARIEEHPSWEMLSQLRVKLRAGVALNRFRVQDLLTLKEGQVFESLSRSTEDIPLMAGVVQLGWSEFEIQEQRLALRLTRLG